MADRSTPRYVSYEALREAELAALQRALPEELDDDEIAYCADYPAGVRICDRADCREPRAPLMEVGDLYFCEVCFEATFEPENQDYTFISEYNDS
jgi:hypothetical protein